MQDSFARARTRPSARDDRVSCIQLRVRVRVRINRSGLELGYG